MLRDVWNRACAGKGTGPGDRHLSALLLVDGMVRNGGPNHAADSCEPAEIAAAATAAHYFGLDDLAGVIGELPAAADDDAADDRLSEAYYRILPDSERLSDALATRHAATPGDFSPM